MLWTLMHFQGVHVLGDVRLESSPVERTPRRGDLFGSRVLPIVTFETTFFFSCSLLLSAVSMLSLVTLQSVDSRCCRKKPERVSWNYESNTRLRVTKKILRERAIDSQVLRTPGIYGTIRLRRVDICINKTVRHACRHMFTRSPIA
jgi:hypothetical protein